MDVKTSQQIRDEKKNQNKPQRQPRRYTFKVEAWAMPDKKCKDQKQRILIDTKLIDALHQQQACDIYIAESDAPAEVYKNRYIVGPLVIVRAVKYVGEQQGNLKVSVAEATGAGSDGVAG